MNNLILGASGKIGSYLIKNDRSFIYTYNSKKIKGGIKFNFLKNDISKIIKYKNINTVTFLGAISDPNVCYKQKILTNKINVISTIKILRELIKKNIYFIFFSSEFVFSGHEKNFSEKDKTKPINIYGKQKLKVEKFIIQNAKRYSIFRIAKTYGDDLNDNTLISNYLKSLLSGKKKFVVASDQFFSPLFVGDLKKIIKIFIKKKIKGTFNIGGPQRLSRYNCLSNTNKFLSKKIKNKIELKKIKLENFTFYDKRPLDVSMNIEKLNKVINFKMTKFSKIAKKMIKKNRLNEKLSKTR